MNDLEDLRHALHSPPDFAPRALDLDQIMARGGRLRTRRRVAASAAAALSVVTVLIGGGLLVDRDHAGPAVTIAPAGTGPATHPQPTDGATARPDPTPVQADQPLGQVIRTGIETGGGEWALYAVPVREASLPKVHFGIMLGVRKAGGELASKVVINETARGDRASGFHEGEAAGVVDGSTTPAFGYFAGPAGRITASVHGRLVPAHLAVWSEDSQIVVFWFDLTAVPPGVRVGKLTAFDHSGRKLGTTTSGFGVG